MKMEFADEIRAQVRKDRQRIVLSSSRDSSFIHLGLVSIFAYTVYDEKNYRGYFVVLYESFSK